MTISQLDLQHIRIISAARLQPNSRYNVFYGENGSGKTSWLEAIHLLSTGYSFRTADSFSLISYGKNDLSAFARTQTEDEISIQVSRKGTRARINQRSCALRSELASLLPCQVFYHDMFEIISAGPALRRKVLDWGLFHVKPDYHPLWKDARLVLKQRNALLKQKNLKPSALVPWDKQWVELSEAMHAYRAEYCVQWFEHFRMILPALARFDCRLGYEKGWDKKNTGKSLADCLVEQFAQDYQYQYTHAGAHQADITLQVSLQAKAKHGLSRGQQKIVLIALKLAQTQLLAKPCLYLLDDITSELDSNHVDLFLNLIATLPGQFFFASLQEHAFKSVWSEKECLFIKLNKEPLLSAVHE